MAFNCRIFGYRGIVQIPFVNQKQFSGDSVYVLQQPYEYSQVLSVTASPLSSTARPATDKTEVLRIEVADGNSIRYEVNPPNRAVNAGNSSPILSGITQINFGPSWTLSVVDAASFA